MEHAHDHHNPHDHGHDLETTPNHGEVPAELQGDYELFETGELPHALEVVDVRVVTPVHVENYPARTIVTDQVPIGTTPQRVAGELRTRAHAMICARGGDVFIGGPQVTTGTGFLVKADQVLSIESTDGIYAIAAAAGVATVHILTQIREG